MISIAEGKEKIAKLMSPVGTETIPLAQAAGRVLRTPITATRDQPPFAASAMDGYAIRRADLAVDATLHVIGENAAGHDSGGHVGPGQAIRIFTGAPLPDGADYVLIQEDTDRRGDQITVRAGYDTKDYVRPSGGDFYAGSKLDAPCRIGVAEIGLMAAMNTPIVEVSRKPVVALIATGDELVWPGETPRTDQIVASNSFALKAMLDAQGAEARMMPIAPDTPAGLMAVFDLCEDADLIVTMGGASVGDHDLVQQVAGDRGLDLSFYKMAMRPGKPLMAGKLGNVPMIGLPGNPVSSIVCGHIFVRPAIDALLGLGYTEMPIETATLGIDIGKNGPREHFMRARVTKTDNQTICVPHQRQDSSLLSVLAQSNALMIRSPNDPARSTGDTVTFTYI